MHGVGAASPGQRCLLGAPWAGTQENGALMGKHVRRASTQGRRRADPASMVADTKHCLKSRTPVPKSVSAEEGGGGEVSG